VDSAVELFSADGYEQTSVRAIAQRAGVTSGAFYARFSGKEAIGLALAERLATDTDAMCTAFEADLHERPLLVALESLFQQVAHLYSEHDSVLRTLERLAHRNRDVADALRRLNDDVFRRIVSAVRRSGAPIDHPDPSTAIAFALLTATNLIKSTVTAPPYFEDGPRPSPAEAVPELVRMCARYLGLSTER